MIRFSDAEEIKIAKMVRGREIAEEVRARSEGGLFLSRDELQKLNNAVQLLTDVICVQDGLLSPCGDICEASEDCFAVGGVHHDSSLPVGTRVNGSEDSGGFSSPRHDTDPTGREPYKEGER